MVILDFQKGKKMEKMLCEFWNKKAPFEDDREKNNPIKQVHTDLIMRKIIEVIGERKNLKILDAGAGSGRFSIKLSEMGHRVTHFDISDEMLKIAKEKSDKQSLNNISFYQGSIDNLKEFKENEFDLVISIDSPISFCYNTYDKAIKELFRVSKEDIIFCVMNKNSVIIEGGINFDLRHYGKPLTVKEVFSTGNLDVNDELLSKKNTLLPSWHAFGVEEIIKIVENNNGYVQNLMAPGTLASFVETELLNQLFTEEENYQEFLSFSEEFDSDKYNIGIGTKGAGALLVIIKKSQHN